MANVLKSIQKSLVIAATIVAGLLSTGAAKAEPVICGELKAKYDACKADSSKDCKDLDAELTSCIAKATTCAQDLSVAMSDPRCNALVTASKGGTPSVPSKPVSLVCDSPAKSDGKGRCTCDNGLFPAAVQGKPGHVSCASTVNPAEVRFLQEQFLLLSKEQMTKEEAKALIHHQAWLRKFYQETADGWVLPDYAANAAEWEAFKAMECGTTDLLRSATPGGLCNGGFIGQLKKDVADIKACLYQGVCPAGSTQASLYACLKGTGSCDDWPGIKGIRDDVDRMKGGRVFGRISPFLGVISGPAGWQIVAPGVAGQIVVPFSGSDVRWYVGGAAARTASKAGGGAAYGRVSTGFEGAISDSFSIGGGLYGAFIGRTSSISVNGRESVGAGQGGWSAGVEGQINVRFGDVIGLNVTPFLGYASQCREGAPKCMNPARGLEGGVFIGPTFTIGAPGLGR